MTPKERTLGRKHSNNTKIRLVHENNTPNVKRCTGESQLWKHINYLRNMAQQRKDYLKKLLYDVENYVELKHGNKGDLIIRKIEKLIKNFEHEITRKEKDYFLKFEWKTSSYYVLPKIHKSQSIKEAIRANNAEYIELPPLGDLTMRTILAEPSSLTHRLNNYIDISNSKTIV